MNKIKMLAVSLLFVFAIGSVNMIACDKTKTSATKTSCNTEVKATSCETANVKKVASKDDCSTKCSTVKTASAKDDCSTKCSSVKTASVKSDKGSCCSSVKDTKLEAKKATNEVKTVAEAPSK